MLKSDLLDDYPIQLEWPIAWGDMDAFDHVNNVIYFKYFESARIAYLNAIRIFEYKNSINHGPILAHTDCKYKFPLKFPDTMTLAARVSELGDDYFNMQYRIISHSSERVAADGTGRVVYYDYENGRRTNMPDELRQRIEQLEAIQNN